MAESKHRTITRQMSENVAGAFYPSDPGLLERTVDTYLREASAVSYNGVLKALMVPHAGYVYSGLIAAKGFKLLRNLDQEKTWRVIIIGTSHYKPFTGFSVGAFKEYATPFGPIPVSSVADEILESGGNFFPDADRNEHSIEVQLPFLKCSLQHVEIVPILTSSTDHEKLADAIVHHMTDSTILLVSSDLSHMKPQYQANEIDHATLNWILNGDKKSIKKRGEACGLAGILTMMALAERLGWDRKLVDYTTSGDVTGDKSRVVGYGCVICFE